MSISLVVFSPCLLCVSDTDRPTGPVPVPIQSSAQSHQHQGGHHGSSSQEHYRDHGVYVRPVRPGGEHGVTGLRDAPWGPRAELGGVLWVQIVCEVPEPVKVALNFVKREGTIVDKTF